MAPVLAVPGLVANLLTPSWLERTVDPDRFGALADIAGSTPVLAVDRPDSLAALPRLCDVMLAEMDRIRDGDDA